MSVNKGPSAEILKALETAPNNYLVLSPELYILTASDAYLEATETKREVIVGKHIFEAFPDNPELPDGDDGVQNINASLQTVLRTKKPDYMRVQRYDVPDISHPGKFIPRYWHPSHTPVLDEQGEISYIIQLANNVTEIILTEKALFNSQLAQVETMDQTKILNEELLLANNELRETQQNLSLLNSQLEERVARRTQELAASNLELETNSSRLRMAIESTQLGTWDYNPRTGDLYWSKECRSIYGIPPDLPASFELFSKLIHPDDQVWVQEKIADSIRPELKGRYDLSYRINRYDNSEVRWIKVKGTVYFEQEQAVRFIGTVLDITDIKLAQEESSKLAAIIASSDDAIVSKTLDGVITSWNRSAERMFGFTAAEMIGESIYKLIPGDRWHEEQEILTRLKSGERVEHFETKRLTKDGRELDVSMSVSPIRDSEGKMIGLSKIARDITERKLDETRKSDFIGMVSHELKTPLTSLNAILQVTESKLKTSEDSFLAGAMQKANVQVKRMTAMINGFLNVSRLESAKIQIEKSNFQLEALVAEVIDEINLTVSSHHISFDPCPPVAILADRDKISSVIANLIGNAVKYSPNGTAIKVKCEFAGNHVMVSVKDNGMGIAPEDVHKIFDRYYRVQSNHSKHISGIGIGLYLSAEIIGRHEGKIWAESEIGKGSTFYFTLPVIV